MLCHWALLQAEVSAVTGPLPPEPKMTNLQWALLCAEVRAAPGSHPIETIRPSMVFHDMGLHAGVSAVTRPLFTTLNTTKL